MEFAGESPVSVVCEMDATVLPQRREKEMPLTPGHAGGRSNPKALTRVGRAAVDSGPEPGRP